MSSGSAPPVAVGRALDALADYPVFLAYNANVDAIVRVDDRLERALDPPADETPDRLGDPADLSAAIAAAMAAGTGDEYPIADDLGRWLAATLDPDEQRLGGQAGNMADALSVLGAAPVLYTYMVSDRQRATFDRPGAVRFPVVDDGLDLVPLDEVPADDRTKINWIFEFETGREFFGTTATADTRLIAAARPERFNLEPGPLEGVADRLGAAVDCALLSGHHSLKPEYADGTGFEEHLDSGRRFIERLRAGNDDLVVGFEYGVTHYDDLRAGIRERIVPHVDAVGLDTRELDLLAGDLGLDASPVRNDDRDPDPSAGDATTDDLTDGTSGDPTDSHMVAQFRALEALMDAFGVDCVKLHATDYFLAVRDGAYLRPSDVRRGFEFASVVAATKALDGHLHRPADLRDGGRCDRSDRGLDAVGTLAAHLDAEADGPALVTPAVVAVPNRVVPDPASTVGIGDVVSAASFALENALYDRRSDDE